jgi:hypothetical protein
MHLLFYRKRLRKDYNYTIYIGKIHPLRAEETNLSLSNKAQYPGFARQTRNFISSKWTIMDKNGCENREMWAGNGKNGNML